MTVETPVGVRKRASARSPRSVVEALVGASLAALAVGLGMLVLRSAIGVRSIPERLMEWLLLFIPSTIFQALLQRFGFDAKRDALDGAAVVILALFGVLGYVVLRRGWPLPAIALLGVGFWLLVMLVVMPLTSAGVFALDLLDGTAEAILGYLAVGLSYAAILGLAHTWISRRATSLPHTRPSLAERRTALSLIAGAASAYVAAYLAALLLPRAASVPSILLADPQEPVPSGGLDVPNPHPQTVFSAIPQPSPVRETPVPTMGVGEYLPEPTAARDMQRDKDGVVLPSGRTTGELATAITSNADFYIVTKNAGGDPLLHPRAWRLLVDGDVQRSFQLDYETLRRLPAVELTKTLECISNFVGKPELAPFHAELISSARWKGVPVRDVLQLTGGPKPDAVWLAVLSADEYTSALPMDIALDPETLLVYEMNGEVLPREHGYPARLLVPGRYGMKSAKWVIGLRPMAREFLDWYGQRNWSKQGIVQTMTRIDSPAPGSSLPAGSQTVSGIAYAGTRGIKEVEYSADGGSTWRPAQVLEAAAGRDSWIRWRGEFDRAPGAGTTLVARAADGTGALQEELFSLPEPDGGTGWPRLEVG